MIRLLLLGLLLLALTIAGASLHVPGALGVGSPVLKTEWVVIASCAAAVYLLAAALAVRGPPVRRNVWVVLLIAAAIRVPPLIAPPFLSTDVYRYVWDGRVQAAGINPYRYIPGAPALMFLRDATVFPRINRANYAPTIYPPAAQMIFGLVARIWSSTTGVKLEMLAFEAVAVFCLLRLLALARLPAERVLIYAWNPLPAWAFAGNGHIDAAAIGLIALALLLRATRRNGWAGAAIGAAIATKFLPAVVAPVLWRRHLGWRSAAAALAVVIGVYALYSSAGLRVFGFLGGYGSEEGLESGSGLWLLAWIEHLTATTLPAFATSLYIAVAALMLAALGAWFAFVRRPDDPVSLCAAAGVMMAVLTFAISPHYPWYFAWLTLPAVLAPNPALIWFGTAPILLYLETQGDRFAWPSVIYVPVILLALARLPWPRAAQPVKENI